tara:strand:+ start:390 stop:494 length:105 start_codon:yes stop_codon:yes gene_type:complete
MKKKKENAKIDWPTAFAAAFLTATIFIWRFITEQ